MVDDQARIEMTLDWIRLATASTKGHFCSVLISNIYWLTSLSTDSTITFSYLRIFPDPLLFHQSFISLQRDALSCGIFLFGNFFVFAVALSLSWNLLRHAAPSLGISVCLCLLFWCLLWVMANRFWSIRLGSLALASRSRFRYFLLLHAFSFIGFQVCLSPFC